MLNESRQNPHTELRDLDNALAVLDDFEEQAGLYFLTTEPDPLFDLGYQEFLEAMEIERIRIQTRRSIVRMAAGL